MGIEPLRENSTLMNYWYRSGGSKTMICAKYKRPLNASYNPVRLTVRKIQYITNHEQQYVTKSFLFHSCSGQSLHAGHINLARWFVNINVNLPCCSSSQRTPSLSRHSHRPPSVADSMAEYYDASEVIVCETSSEAEASDESGLSDITTTSNSEPDEGHGEYCPSTHLFLYFH